MPTLMEMMMQGANGQMVDQMARQYDLSRDQTIAAMEALMPAFSQGLKRNASDPFGFLQFLDALSGGRHSSYYDNPAQAFGPSGLAEGNAILGHLFGSKEVSRAVAAQAAQMTGLSQSILKSMLSSLAPIILGGLFGQLSGAAGQRRRDEASPQPGDSPLGPLGDIFGQMTGGSANPWGKMFEEMMGDTKPQRRRAEQSGTANPWGKMLEEMMGGAKAGDRTGAPAGDNPLGRMFEEMLRGGQARDDARDRPPEEEAHTRPPTRGYEDLFGDMFDTGRKVQKDYQRNMESIFDQFLGGMRKDG